MVSTMAGGFFFVFFFPHAQGPAKRPVWLGPVKEGSGEDVEFKS